MMNIKRMPSCIAVVVAALLLAVSCGNMLEAPKAEGVEGGTGRLSVSMGDGRAVFPEELEFEADKELTFTLSGSLDGGEDKEIRSWSAEGDKTAYQVMVADTSLTVEAGQWRFTLQAKRGGTVVATASKDLEVRGGTTNKLSFGTMAYSDDGTGTVTVTISWNEVERVTSVVVGLYNASDDTMVDNIQQPLTPAESKVTYKQNVPAGTYRLKAQMYQDDAVIGSYSELVRVAGGLSSVATRNLESLNTLYTVKLDFGEEGSLSAGSSFTETYNRSQTVTLPTAEQVASTTGAVFLHWYEEGDTEKKEVTEISGLDGDKTYCAYWQVAPVTFTPPTDTKFYLGESIEVSLTSEDGATIQYHLGDGSWKDYDAGSKIQVTDDTTITTITAKATKDGLKPSDATTATYTVRQLKGITVTPPARTVYSVGEEVVHKKDDEIRVTATYDDEEERTVTGTITTDTSTLTESAGVQTVTVRYSEGGIVVSGQFEIRVLPKKLTNYTSPNHTGSEWTYVEFGEWPQTIKDASVNVYETESKQMGMFTYYLGSDKNWYVKVTAKPYQDTYTYSDGNPVEEDKVVYFKVEPIKWRVLNEDYASTGNALLLAESILTGGVPYYVSSDWREITKEKETWPVTVFANNWQYSSVRAWLNGLDVVKGDGQENDKTYTDKGFLQSAFTADAQTLIADTTVDNTAASTTDAGSNLPPATDYACDKTKDKIFLLSQQEATNSEYGFAAYSESGPDSTRIRVTTDYAKATGVSQEGPLAGSGGSWWLRSPHCDIMDFARIIINDGDASYDGRNPNVYFTDVGVVPALSISLAGN